MWGRCSGEAGYRCMHVSFCHFSLECSLCLAPMTGIAMHVRALKALLPAAKHCLAQPVLVISPTAGCCAFCCPPMSLPADRGCMLRISTTSVFSWVPC